MANVGGVAAGGRKNVREPKPGKGDRCRVCGKPRPDLAVLSSDPFCSAVCCRRHYGVVDTAVASTASEPEAVRVTAGSGDE